MNILKMCIKQLTHILFLPILLLTVVNCGGGGGGGGGGDSGGGTAPTATGTVTWDSPTTNMDGSCILTGLTGYKIYYGTTSRAGSGATPNVNDSGFSYDSSVTIPLIDTNLTCTEDTTTTPVAGCGFKKVCGYTATLSGLTSGSTYYAAVTAYDAAGYESDYSIEVSKTAE